MRAPSLNVRSALVPFQINALNSHPSAIEVEDKFVPWAAAGSNATLNLTGIEAINLGIGSVLCPLTDLIPLATVFTARIIVFDIQVPITAGTSVRTCFAVNCRLHLLRLG